eukprot:CAMPEP_0194237606 /NCGR_PEP_ID=MMETSP0158-20130606/4568_1 /TAXON_ID=33649 /ORGANISM="Thalassionema nitzschioides, Strain L26-B" /LENGTH=520 /DNA_ID=CAMNT_0038971677 /DNA_START=157 /DNA_END=1719 /DNA_ORIENTATION=+
MALPIFILYRLVSFIYRFCSKLVNATRNVSFQQHSDGSISSQQYYFDRDKAPSVGPMDNATTSSTDKKSNSIRTRVATPMPKKKRETVMFGFTPKEQNYDDISKQFGGKENFAPISHRNDYAPIRSWPEITAKSLSIESSNGKTNYISENSVVERGTNLVLQSQSKQSSPYSETPMKANFLIPYASSTPSSRLFHHDYQSSLSITKNEDTKNLQKRAFKLTANADQSFQPRKRLALTRSDENGRKSHKALDPEKRKQRQDRLLKEFNRKRPKVEDRTVAANHAPQLGNKERASITPTGDKPQFQFGSGVPDTDGAPIGNAASKPTTFAMGASVGTTQPKENSAITFGASTPASVVPKEPTRKFEAHKASVTFYDKPASSQDQTQCKSDGNKSAVSFAVTTDKPSFGLGGNQTQVSSTTTPKVAFTPGASVPAPPDASVNAPKPAVSFGGIHPAPTAAVANSQTSTSTFAFGGNTSTTSTTAPQFGVPQFAPQQRPPPAMPSAAAKRKAAQRKSRSRRGAA